MNSLTPNRRAAYVEQPKKLSPTFYRTARACTINPAPHQVCRNSWACRAKQKKTISIGIPPGRCCLPAPGEGFWLSGCLCDEAGGEVAAVVCWADFPDRDEGGVVGSAVMALA
ncbi:hypothetical protein HPB52_009796 [Rhipicephalus sanguineus]|uniref:Uncharacterized protein n=1 Tax=Rhipicephalus sanguineus TaxID=34632 RepID=A0A9D4T973_RHISA|nr:hypothetical protein HPB52_009796 [Rhipicephalus sanguineus]